MNAILPAPPADLGTTCDVIAADAASDLELLAGTSPAALLESQLPLIEELIRRVARRYRLSRPDVEEFASIVRLRLVEHDYGILRKFRGQSSLRTFLTVVVARQCLDYLAGHWGKWRPSAEAKRLGPAAVRLETLVFRDGLPFDEACARLATSDADLTPERLRAVMDWLPPRVKRQFVDERSLETLITDTPAPDAGLAVADAQRTSRALAAALARLDAPDRVIVKLRFFDRLSVADIARRHGLDQGGLYRRLERLLDRLKADLETHGIGRGDVATWVDQDEAPAN